MNRSLLLSSASILLFATALTHAQAPVTPKPTGVPGVTFEPQVPPFSVDYPLTEDSKPQPGVPKGIVFDIKMDNAKEFPNTSRKITVYIPAQYKADKPACVWVLLDHLGLHANTVFDNLIAKKQMPVTIAIGIEPGQVEAHNSKLPRYDRSFEFDNPTSRLADFILNEVLPLVESSSAPDGRKIILSKDPNDHAISGGSTGGIGAFNAAWQRPDGFRRVYSIIGTFVGMRGGEKIYVQVRKTEPKPIRVFLEDGAYDGWGGGLEMGDWYMSNLTMNRALEFAGYDVRHVWGTGNHNGNQGEQIFPDVVRWLWRDYPAPIVAQPPNSQALKPILIDGEPWKLASDCAAGTHLAADKDGAVYTAIGKGVTKLSGSCPASTTAGTVAFAPDGRAFVAAGGSIDAYDAGGKKTSIEKHTDATALAFRSNGDLYFAQGTELWLMRANGEEAKVGDGLRSTAALALTPDGHWLLAAQANSHLSYSFRVLADGKLDSGEPYYDFYVPAASDGSGASAVAMDREGRAYVATKLGVQVCDHNGRVMAILPLPGNAPAESLTFGGDGFTTLYVVSGGKLYTRKMKIGGVSPASPPISLPNWGAG